MKYNTKDSVSEIKKRRRQMDKKAGLQKIRSLSGSCVFVLSLIVFSFFQYAEGGAGIVPSSYGALFLSAEAGAYALVAVLFFVIGAVITAFLLKKHR